MTVIAYIDGGARGNPGPAGYGVRIERADGTLIQELSEPLGIATNNVAEYHGLIAALTYLVAHGHRRALIRSDSELLVRQMRGEYRVRHPGLQPLHRRARELAARLEHLELECVPRDRNAAADRLANRAMDETERTRQRAATSEGERPRSAPPRRPANSRRRGSGRPSRVDS